MSVNVGYFGIWSIQLGIGISASCLMIQLITNRGPINLTTAYDERNMVRLYGYNRLVKLSFIINLVIVDISHFCHHIWVV